MKMDGPTKDWSMVGNLFFRKTEIYTFSWGHEIDFDKVHVVGACFGGPIVISIFNKSFSSFQQAITRDLLKKDAKQIIHVYSASGLSISSFRCESSSTMIGIAWSSIEDILVLNEKGEIYIHDLHGNLKNICSIGKDAKDCTIVDFKCFNTINTYSNTYTTGISLLTSKMKFYLIKDIYNQKLQKFPDLPGLNLATGASLCWTVVSVDKKCFILAVKGNDIYQLTLESLPQILTLGSNKVTSTIISIIPSFNNENLAIATETGQIMLCNSDLTRTYYEYQHENEVQPMNLAWCSNQAVVASWDSLMLITIDGETFNYFDSPPFCFVMECDGLRVLTSQTHEFLQMVPKSVEEIFRIGADGPSANLYAASISYYKEKSQRADEYIRAIKAKKKLEEAISVCIEAASLEYDAMNQKALLYSSLFGRYFEEYPNPSQFVDMCQTLRVLNAIRHHSIGIPLTYTQYEALTPQVIINRLVLRHHYALAMKICEYLNIPDGSKQILKNWALFKVRQTHVDDTVIAQLIREKLSVTDSSGDISYAEIAQCAIDVGRHDLAIKLLEYETKASDQVPLYMKIKNQELALKKSIESGDSDLIYMVLFWLKEKFNNVSDFMKYISKNEVAMSLMLQYYRQNDVLKLCDILNQENKNLEQAMSLVKVAYKQTTSDQRLKLLDEAQRLFRGRDEFNYGLIGDEIKLIKIQTNLQRTHNLQLSDKTINETIGQLIKKNLLKEAEDLRKEFKINDSDRTWWFIKCKYLAEGRLWDELDRFGKSKKSPIGYEPFVEACMKQNQLNEAEKYYTKLQANESKVKCLIQMRKLSEALDLSFQLKDEMGVNMVLAKCDFTKDRVLIEKAKSIKQVLSN